MNLNGTILTPKCNDDEECMYLFNPSLHLDDIKRFMLFPLNVLGIVLNVLFLILFSQKIFKNRIYSYFKFFSLNNLIFDSTELLFNFNTRKYGNSMNSKWVITYIAYVYPISIATSYSWQNFLDILILFERIFLISNRFKAFTNSSVPLNSVVVLVLASFMNLPYVFFYKVDSKQVIKNSDEIFTYRYMIITPFYRSDIGYLLSYLQFIFRDLLFFILKIAMSFVLITLYKKHYKKRKKLVQVKDNSMAFDTNNNISLFMISNRSITIKSNKRSIKLNKSDGKLTKLAIIMCLKYVVFQFIFWLFTIYSRFNWNVSAEIFIYCSFCYKILNATNILLYFFYDRNFQIALKDLFCFKFKKNRINS